MHWKQLGENHEKLEKSFKSVQILVIMLCSRLQPIFYEMIYHIIEISYTTNKNNTYSNVY